jgi:hypothetical protein
MKRFWIIVSSTAAIAILWFASIGGASVGDVIYIGQPSAVVELTGQQKVKLKEAVLASWAGTTANSIDSVECRTTFVGEKIEVDVPDIDEEGNPTGTTHKEWQSTGKQIPLFTCEAFDEQTLTDEQFAQLAIEGKLVQGDIGRTVRSLGRITVPYGSALESTWNTFTQSVISKNIGAIFRLKLWRSNPTMATVISGRYVPLHVKSPADFKADWEAGKVDKALGRVQ